MDPLSICASVVALIQAANGIISVCYQYRAALYEQPWALSQIFNQICDLRSTLEQVEKLATRIKASPKSQAQFTTIFSQSADGPLARCEEELEKLSRLLRPSKLAGVAGTHRNALVTVMTWQLKDREAQAHLKRIEQLKLTLNLSLSTASTSLLLDIDKQSSEINDKLTTLNGNITIVRDHLQEVRKHSQEERQQRLSHILCPVDPAIRHKSTRTKRAGDTTDWLLQSASFRRFKSTVSQALWISGRPGTGKTVLFSSMVNNMVESMQQGNAELVAYFYCDFRDRQLQTLISIAAALVDQLCRQADIIPTQLEAVLNPNNKGAALDQLDIDVLKDVILFFCGGYHVTLLVDALDECEESLQLAAFLSDLIRASQIQILITSRPDPGLETRLKPFERLELESCSADMDGDIARYIDDCLAQDDRLSLLSDTVKKDIREALNQKSAGMFRWTQCQLTSLTSMQTVKQIRQALKVLPLGLDDTYQNILQKVLPHNVVFVQRILLWLSFSVMPLTLTELHEAIAVDIESDSIDEEDRLSNPHDALALCGSLVHLNSAGFVALAHMSVKDYLLSDLIKRNESTKPFALAKQEANLELAKSCLAYLRFKEFRQGPSRSLEAYADRLAQHPLVRHAAVSWPYYYRAASAATKDESTFFSFFEAGDRDAFMSWVQVLNADYAYKWSTYPAFTTSLYYAASFGLDDIVKKLIAGGAALDTPGSRFGGTALHAAVLRDYQSTIRILLEAGADAAKADFLRTSPLHTAVALASIDSINLLLKYGASAEATNTRGETPADWARLASALEALHMKRHSSRTGDMKTSAKALAVCDADDLLQVWYKRAGAGANTQPSSYTRA